MNSMKKWKSTWKILRMTERPIKSPKSGPMFLPRIQHVQHGLVTPMLPPPREFGENNWRNHQPKDWMNNIEKRDTCPQAQFRHCKFLGGSTCFNQ